MTSALTNCPSDCDDCHAVLKTVYASLWQRLHGRCPAAKAVASSKKQFTVTSVRKDGSLSAFPFQAAGYPSLSCPGFTNFTCVVMKAASVAHQGTARLRSHKITKRVHFVLISHPHPPYSYKPQITGREHDLSPPKKVQCPGSYASAHICPKRSERK